MATAKPKSKWTDQIHSPISVLNHAQGLHLERFASEDLDEIAGCDDVLELALRSSKMSEPVDLSRLAHITGLRKLSLDKLAFTNLAALRALPHLQQLVIDNGMFSDFDALNGFKALRHLLNALTRLVWQSCCAWRRTGGGAMPEFGTTFIYSGRTAKRG